MEEYKINVIYDKNDYLLVANSASMYKIFKNSKLVKSGCCDTYEETKNFIENYAKTTLKGGKRVKK